MDWTADRTPEAEPISSSSTAARMKLNRAAMTMPAPMPETATPGAMSQIENEAALRPSSSNQSRAAPASWTSGPIWRTLRPILSARTAPLTAPPMAVPTASGRLPSPASPAVNCRPICR